MCTYIYIYMFLMSIGNFPERLSQQILAGMILVRSVFRISCLFLRPRPWQLEI